MYDDLKDFLVMHYMGGREDSEFWKYIKTGVTKTEFVKDLLEMAKTNIPTVNVFNDNPGSANWGLWSYVMEGINVINKDVAGAELDVEWDGRNLSEHAQLDYYEMNKQWDQDLQNESTYKEFIEYFRGF
jgi:tryptophan halogenase